MKPNKLQATTRKPPALSVEEELAELLADPTLKPTISFLGLKEPVVSGYLTDSVPVLNQYQILIQYRILNSLTASPNPARRPIIFNSSIGLSGIGAVSDTISTRYWISIRY